MKLLKFWPLAALGVVALGLSCYMGAVGRDAQTKAEIQRLTRELASSRGRLAVTDTVYARDTVVLYKSVAKYHTAHDTVLKYLTDTVRVKAFVLIADSTIKACSVALLTCEQRVAERNVVIAGQDSLIAQLRKRKPFLLRIGKPVLPFLGGVVTGLILTR